MQEWDHEGKYGLVGRGGQSWPLGGESITPQGNSPGTSNCVADFSPFCERTMRAFMSGERDDEGHRYALRGNQAMRLCVFTDPIQSFSLRPYGQSEDPKSPHYNDQAKMLSEKRLKPTYFRKKDLLQHLESTLVLEIPDE